jgi:hypothetical protein
MMASGCATAGSTSVTDGSGRSPTTTCLAGPSAPAIAPPWTVSPQQRADALAAVDRDPVTAQVVGGWHVALAGPIGTTCAAGAHLLGVTFMINFDRPQSVTWDENGDACVNGAEQPVRYQNHWRGLRSASAEVFLPSRAIQWTPLPPPDFGAQASDDRTIVATLGPRAGPCPPPPPGD